MIPIDARFPVMTLRFNRSVQAVMPMIKKKKPFKSNGFRRFEAISGIAQIPAANPSKLNGMVRKKMTGHPHHSVNQPPRAGPRDNPM